MVRGVQGVSNLIRSNYSPKVSPICATTFRGLWGWCDIDDLGDIVYFGDIEFYVLFVQLHLGG